MRKTSRTNKTAQAMIEAGQSASIIIEACENKHHLNKAEALDVLCGCVVNFLTRDGELEEEKVRKRFYDFADQLVGFVNDTLGIDLSDDNYGKDCS